MKNKTFALVFIIGMILILMPIICMAKFGTGSWDKITPYKTDEYQYNGNKLIINNSKIIDNVDDIRYSNGTLYVHQSNPGDGFGFAILILFGVIITAVFTSIWLIDLKFDSQRKNEITEPSTFRKSVEGHGISITDKVPDEIKRTVKPNIKEGVGKDAKNNL